MKADLKALLENMGAQTEPELDLLMHDLIQWGYVPEGFQPQGETFKERLNSLRAKATVGFYHHNPDWEPEYAPRGGRPLFPRTTERRVEVDREERMRKVAGDA